MQGPPHMYGTLVPAPHRNHQEHPTPASFLTSHQPLRGPHGSLPCPPQSQAITKKPFAILLVCHWAWHPNQILGGGPSYPDYSRRSNQPHSIWVSTETSRPQAQGSPCPGCAIEGCDKHTHTTPGSLRTYMCVPWCSGSSAQRPGHSGESKHPLSEPTLSDPGKHFTFLPRVFKIKSVSML